jgi:hypothetical protein
MKIVGCDLHTRYQAEGHCLARYEIRTPPLPFFITFFSYAHHRHAIAIVREFPRQCSIENCARLQRRTHHPP